MQTKVIAIEFTLTAMAAQAMWVDPRIHERIIGTPRGPKSIRFRILVPKCSKETDNIEAFYHRRNDELNESGWERIGKHGVVVGGFTVWHRVAVILTLQILLMRLTARPLKIEGGALEATGITINELPTGAVLVDLSEV